MSRKYDWLYGMLVTGLSGENPLCWVDAEWKEEGDGFGLVAWGEEKVLRCWERGEERGRGGGREGWWEREEGGKDECVECDTVSSLMLSITDVIRKRRHSISRPIAHSAASIPPPSTAPLFNCAFTPHRADILAVISRKFDTSLYSSPANIGQVSPPPGHWVRMAWRRKTLSSLEEDGTFYVLWANIGSDMSIAMIKVMMTIRTSVVVIMAIRLCRV